MKSTSAPTLGMTSCPQQGIGPRGRAPRLATPLVLERCRVCFAVYRERPERQGFTGKNQRISLDAPSYPERKVYAPGITPSTSAAISRVKFARARASPVVYILSVR